MKGKTFLFLLLINFSWISCDKNQMTTPQNNHSCSDFVDSRDGEKYSVVTIGNQCWMAENLRYNASSSWLNPNNLDPKYGRLYNWTTAQTVCPNGWHLPTDNEWKTMEISLGLSPSDADLFGQYRGMHGTKMKSKTGWATIDNNANSSSFNAFPSGKYLGGFLGLGDRAIFWSATEYSVSEAWHRRLYDNIPGVDRFKSDKTEGLSCRCIKDQ